MVPEARNGNSLARSRPQRNRRRMGVIEESQEPEDEQMFD